MFTSNVVFVPQMDGDSSTTDASQLGITGEYMASSHYVLQSQDGERQRCRKRRPSSSGFGLRADSVFCVCFAQTTQRRV